MKKVFILHSAYGSPTENWIPWLKSQLEKDYEVIVPEFPTPSNQSIDSWNEVIEEYSINENDILIGHSVSATFILSLLEKNKVSKTILVSPFYKSIGIERFDKINSSFYKTFSWELIKQNSKEFHIFYSETDPYVPSQQPLELKNHLNCPLYIIPHAGHFNDASGYIKFPQLLELLNFQPEN